MCYQVMFAWQRQPKQETLSHMTSKTESIKWAVQLLKTNFTFIRSGYLCSRHEVCQPHFSLTRFSAASRILMNWHCNMYERWHWDEFMKSQVPTKYEQSLLRLLSSFEMSISKAFVFLGFIRKFVHSFSSYLTGLKIKEATHNQTVQWALVWWGQSQGQPELKSSFGYRSTDFLVWGGKDLKRLDTKRKVDS